MPFLELINGVAYEFYQVNGTKYYKNYNPCPIAIREELDKCAGEMYLSRINKDITADQVATVASLLGELYILRFKINFAGLARGFAYLQYMNPNLMEYAITILPKLFKEHGLGLIKVQCSKNSSNLVLRNVIGMNYDEVLSTLTSMCNYLECNLRCNKRNKMEYQLVFGSNEDAVKARRILIGQTHVFGSEATIGWD